MDNAKNWGGKRSGAGRKKEDKPKKSVVIRVDESLLSLIKILKQKISTGEAIGNLENLLSVTSNQEDYQAELDKREKISLDLVLQRDKARLNAVGLEGKNRALQSTVKNLKSSLRALDALKHDCQALTKSGTRCTRPAKLKTHWHGIEINTCLQHHRA